MKSLLHYISTKWLLIYTERPELVMKQIDELLDTDFCPKDYVENLEQLYHWIRSNNEKLALEELHEIIQRLESEVL